MRLLQPELTEAIRASSALSALGELAETIEEEECE